jgi:hypothetical protein
MQSFVTLRDVLGEQMVDELIGAVEIYVCAASALCEAF